MRRPVGGVPAEELLLGSVTTSGVGGGRIAPPMVDFVLAPFGVVLGRANDPRRLLFGSLSGAGRASVLGHAFPPLQDHLDCSEVGTVAPDFVVIMRLGTSPSSTGGTHL